MPPSEPSPSPRCQPGPWRIAVYSSSVLILELALIRQVPAEVRVISYFTNLLMMAAFFGFGLGCLLEKARALAWTVPVGVVLACAYVLATRGLVIFDEASPVHYWLQYDHESAQSAARIPVLPAAAVAFLICALPFLGLGQALAREMSRHARLTAYAWDIGGSLGGVLLFTLGSWSGLPPWAWPPVIMTAWTVTTVRGPLRMVANLAAGAVFLAFVNTPLEARWSPYYLVQHQQEPHGIQVWVNSSFHQFAIDFRPTQDAAHQEMLETSRQRFGIPYDIYRHHHQGRNPERVLVLGAGTGNDVNIALMNGAQRVVAVEIDPVILALGARNTLQPYQDPRVTTVVDDARHFVQSTHERFDLVVLATLDSQTLLSGHANIRLENYVYTRESFASIRNVLAPGGMFAGYYSVFRPWFYKRIFSTVSEAFDGNANLLSMDSPVLFNTIVLAASDGPPLGAVQDQALQFKDDLVATDDWPFLYLERPTIAPVYQGLLVLLCLLLALVLALVKRMHGRVGGNTHMLLLGVGFTLVESAAVVRMALLFGSTWVTNAVVFAAVLLTVFLANVAVMRGFAPRLPWAWGGVVLGLLVNFSLELGPLLALSPGLRVAAAVVLVGVPVFCGSVCFSRLFERATHLGTAFGLNLVGAMAGGMVEYISMLVGMRGVWGLATVVYLFALLSSRALPSAPE